MSPTVARLAALPFLFALSLPVAAQQDSGRWGFVQAGSNRDQVQNLTAGVSWPLGWERQALGGQLTAAAEVSASYWRARDFAGGRQGFWQLAVVPMLRYRFSEGRSPWFTEIGIGVTASNKRYVTPDKTFSTRLNFSDNLAVGRSFGDDWQHELSLRLQHVSNAGIKKPNPGEDFVQLRYAMRF